VVWRLSDRALQGFGMANLFFLFAKWLILKHKGELNWRRALRLVIRIRIGGPSSNSESEGLTRRPPNRKACSSQAAIKGRGTLRFSTKTGPQNQTSARQRPRNQSNPGDHHGEEASDAGDLVARRRRAAGPPAAVRRCTPRPRNGQHRRQPEPAPAAPRLAAAWPGERRVRRRRRRSLQRRLLRPRPQVERPGAPLVDVRVRPGLQRQGLHGVQDPAGGGHGEQVRPPAGPALPPRVREPLHRGRVQGADARRPGRRRGDRGGRGGRWRAAPLHQRRRRRPSHRGGVMNYPRSQHERVMATGC
jgi:hypothetical protein